MTDSHLIGNLKGSLGYPDHLCHRNRHVYPQVSSGIPYTSPWWSGGKESANAGDVGSRPGPRRSHLLRSNQGRGPRLPRLRSRAWERQLLKPNALEPLLHDQRARGAAGPLDSGEAEARGATETRHSQE